MTDDYDHDRLNISYKASCSVGAVIVIVTSHSLEVSRLGTMPETLAEDGQHADDDGEQGCTFDESASDDHTGLDFTGGFGLTGHGFHG